MTRLSSRTAPVLVKRACYNLDTPSLSLSPRLFLPRPTPAVLAPTWPACWGSNLELKARGIADPDKKRVRPFRSATGTSVREPVSKRVQGERSAIVSRQPITTAAASYLMRDYTLFAIRVLQKERAISPRGPEEPVHSKSGRNVTREFWPAISATQIVSGQLAPPALFGVPPKTGPW